MNAPALYDRLYLPLKFMTALALSYFAYRVLVQYQATGYWLYLGVLAGEVLVVGLVLIARRPQAVTVTPRALFFTNAATFYFLFVSLQPGKAWAPPAIPGLLVVAGLVTQIAAKLTLGRGFGLLPARRGIVVSGLYRIVRHPIYAGYFLTHLGFFLVATSWHNFFVFALLYACQVMRIVDEEALLAQDPEYAAYMRRVRWRLVPGIF